jgi:hypothetical protein
MRCARSRCSVDLPRNTQVRLTAVLGEKATFGGYGQYPIRTPDELIPWLGDPLVECIPKDVVDMIARGDDVLDCPLIVKADTDVTAEFGEVPERIDVAFADPSELDKLIKPISPPLPPPPIDAEKLEDIPAIVASIVPPEFKPPQIPPPPPPPQEAPKQPPPQQPPPNMVMVEVQDKNLVDKAPDDAKHLSDKNRDVAEETRAIKTNLDKESEGKAEASRESDDTKSAEIGGPDDRIRQLEETKATTDQRVKETDHSGESKVAVGAIQGEGGEQGQEGTGEATPGILSMRGIGGRGTILEQKNDGKKAGKKGLPGINTSMAFQDYERIMGREKVDEERQVAARKMSSKKGRWERKLDAIKSSLENFVPDVRPGNQTALKTRAHPYALYIARMHRRIHELWGFGFLEDLDDKSADHPLNDPNLWVNLEVSVNTDGSVHKVTIAKTSGKTEFDVAATTPRPRPFVRSTVASTCAGASIATGASAARSTSSPTSSPKFRTTVARACSTMARWSRTPRSCPARRRSCRRPLRHSPHPTTVVGPRRSRPTRRSPTSRRCSLPTYGSARSRRRRSTSS